MELRGASVPDALSFIGFDEVELDRYVFPALTAISQPVQELGTLATTYLLERIRRDLPGPPCRRILLEARLLVRDSRGPAPS